MNQETNPDSLYRELKLTPEQIEESHERMRHSLGKGKGANLSRGSISFLLAFFESEIASTQDEKELIRKLGKSIDRMDGVE